MRRSYPSDITQEQFELIEDDLLSARKQTHPRKYSLYDVFCAVLYLLKEGCTWRAIPHDCPTWQNVRYHYEIWSKPNDDGISLLDRVLRKLVYRFVHNDINLSQYPQGQTSGIKKRVFPWRQQF